MMQDEARETRSTRMSSLVVKLTLKEEVDNCKTDLKLLLICSLSE